MKRSLATFLVVSLVCGWTATAQAEISLVLGLYPSEKPHNMVHAFRPSLDAVEQAMERQLGEDVSIRTQILSDYLAGLEQVLYGSVDFARLGPVSYVLGKNRDSGIELLAMENEKGSVDFEGVIAVRDSSDITDVSQLTGRSFAFVSERSTLGRYFAQAYLAQVGVHAEDLGGYHYLGNHEIVGLAVGAGRYDAGALNRRIFDKLTARGVHLRAIASFRNVTRAWVARSGLQPRVREALRQALLGLDDPQVLKVLGFNGFLPGDDARYDKTRRVIAQNALFFSELQQDD
jgi:phosphonate transport system substrate-binding protein